MEIIKSAEQIIDEWLIKNKEYSHERDNIVTLFEVAMENSILKEKSYFGYPKNIKTLSILSYGLYLVGIYLSPSGKGKMIDIMVDTDISKDKDISKETRFKTRPVIKGGAKGVKELNLYWVYTNFDNIRYLIAEKKIWHHHKITTEKLYSIGEYKEIESRITGKFLVKDILSSKQNLIPQKISQQEISQQKISQQEIIHEKFEKELRNSLNDTHQNRKERLRIASKKPKNVLTQTKIFLRNADVIAEVLHRANGDCDYCRQKAPFIKDTDGQGYLEVHHIIPLANEGEDTVENAVALCPNCHRQAHFGKNTFDLELLKQRYSDK